MIKKLLSLSRQRNLLLLACMMLSLGAWGDDYEELFSISSGDVVTNNSYAAYTTTVNNRGFVITFGGNNKSLGTNSNNRSKCNLSSYEKYAVSPVTTSTVASAFACTSSISDVSKISYTFNGGSNQTNTNVYLLYSSDNNTFSQVPLTSGTQGSNISSGTEYVFNKMSGYFALLFVATNSSGNWRIDDVNITFYTTTSGSTPTCAVPTFSPTAGTYTSAPTVTINCATESATIYYTTDGEDPTTESSIYSSPFVVTTSGTTLKAMAVKSEMNNSAIASATYIIQPEKPTINIEGKNVTITAEDGLSIYYTIDGANPTNESTLYTVPFTLDETCTVKAISVDEYGNVSQITSKEYVSLDVYAKNIGSNYFVKVNDVSILEAGDAVIIVNDTHNRAMSATDKGNNRDGIVTTIVNGVLDNPANTIQKLILVGETDSWSFFTGSGYLRSSSSSSNNLQTKPELVENSTAEISISNGDATIKFNGSYTKNLIRYNSNSSLFSCYSTGQLPVQLYVEVERPSVAAPTFSVEEGVYDADQTVEISCEAEGATIYYTLDGSEPTNASTEYTTAITITETTTIKAVAYVGDEKSNVSSVTITINKPATAANIAELKEFESNTANIVLTLTNAQVLYVNGKDMYVQDASGAIDFYNCGLDYTAGQMLNGTVKVTYELYSNGLPEVTNVSENNLSTTDGSAVPVEVSATSLTLANDMCKLVKVTGAYADKAIDGVTIYNKWKIADIDLNTFEATQATATGIVVPYNGEVEIALITLNDVTPVTVNISDKATGADDKYYSSVYYSNKALVVPANVQCQTYKMDGKLTVSKIYAAGSVVPAGQGVVIKANASGTVTFAVTTEAGEGDANSQLYGVDEATLINESGYKYYKLTLNSSGKAGTAGFYWDTQSENGTKIKAAAHKVYLKVPAGSVGSKSSFVFGDETDGIRLMENGNMTMENAEIYNLAGQRVNKAQKGIYIVNGKKVVIK